MPELKIPLLEQLRDYDRDQASGDLVAGLTTAIMLIPQAMAYAMLAGLPPIVGLYSSVVPLALYALLGTSRQLAVGPVAMVSLLVASAVAPLAELGSDQYVAYAVLLALMVGVFQTAMGLLRLGFLVDLLSHPVVAGFTSAAALIIGLSQLKHLLGVDIPRSHHIHEILLQAIERAGEIHPITLGIGLASILALVVLKKVSPRFPRFLLVVAGGTLAVWGLDLDQAGVKIVGDVPAGLPGVSLPTVDRSAMSALLPMALTISFVGFMESISVAKAFARKGAYDIDANQELIGLGVANLGGAVFGAYPVTGGFSRTAVNAQAGARTGVAAMITAGAIALTLLFLTPLFYFLPKAVLAAIIMTAVFGLIDVAEARHLWKVSRPDLAMMGLTFVATLTLGIEQGILAGVAASLAWYVYQGSRPHVAVLGRLPDTTVYRKLERFPEAERSPGLVVVRVDAPLFFANCAYLRDELGRIEAERSEPTTGVVLDASGINSMDASAATTLEDLVQGYQQRGIAFYIAAARGPVRDVMHRSHLVETLGDDHLVQTVHEAVCRLQGPPLKLMQEGA